jgi:hypothetical protein
MVSDQSKRATAIYSDDLCHLSNAMGEATAISTYLSQAICPWAILEWSLLLCLTELNIYYFLRLCYGL